MGRFNWRVDNGFRVVRLDPDGDVIGQVLFREPGCYMASCGAENATLEDQDSAAAWVVRREDAVFANKPAEKERAAIVKWLRNWPKSSPSDDREEPSHVCARVADLIEKGAHQ